MNVLVPFRALLGLIFGAIVALAPMDARAQDASPWQNDGHSGLRLLAGSRDGPVLLGGIAIRLQPGWHTYWRNPGDSGVPPRFDFSKSDNIESVTVLWPAPKKFADGAGGTSFGYLNDIVLPLRIVTKHTDWPITLRADINYAVCERLCVPVEARAELAFNSAASTQDGPLKAALDMVPKPAVIGDANPLTIRDVRRDGKTAVVIDVVAADTDIDLFAEGPTPDWSLPVPKLQADSPSGLKRFVFELDGLPPGEKPDGAMLKLTLVGPTGAYEFAFTLP